MNQAVGHAGGAIVTGIRQVVALVALAVIARNRCPGRAAGGEQRFIKAHLGLEGLHFARAIQVLDPPHRQVFTAGVDQPRIHGDVGLVRPQAVTGLDLQRQVPVIRAGGEGKAEVAYFRAGIGVLDQVIGAARADLRLLAVGSGMGDSDLGIIGGVLNIDADREFLQVVWQETAVGVFACHINDVAPVSAQRKPVAPGLLDNYPEQFVLQHEIADSGAGEGALQQVRWLGCLARHRSRCRRRGRFHPLFAVIVVIVARTERKAEHQWGEHRAVQGADCCQWTALRVGKGFCCVLLYHKPEHGPARWQNCALRGGLYCPNRRRGFAAGRWHATSLFISTSVKAGYIALAWPPCGRPPGRPDDMSEHHEKHE